MSELNDAQPEVDVNKVAVHIQTRKSDTINSTINDRSDNNNVSYAGSNNVVVEHKDTTTPPLSDYFSVVSLNAPAFDDGVFRNVKVFDEQDNFVDNQQTTFMLNGFFSEAHREEFINNMNNTDSLIINGMGQEYNMIMSVQELYMLALIEPSDNAIVKYSVEDLTDHRMTIMQTDLAMESKFLNLSGDTISDIGGVTMTFSELDIVGLVSPLTLESTDYDVWDDDSLSDSSTYTVFSSAYETELLPVVLQNLLAI